MISSSTQQPSPALSPATSASSSDGDTSAPWRPDAIFCGALLILLSLGLLTLYSSSSVYAARMYGNAQHFITLQMVWLGLSLVALCCAATIPRHWLLYKPGWLFVAASLLCALVLLPDVGHQVAGARRWLRLGPVGFQPSELAKLALVVLLAALLTRRCLPKARRRAVVRSRQAGSATPSSILGPVVIAQLPVLLVLCEPDLGTALVMESLIFLMVFAAGLSWRAIVLGALMATPLFYHLLLGTPFRLKRLLSYLDPWSYRLSSGYQITEALIAIGSGGPLGMGLGESKQKLFFLPEAHTDFIFAILAEELGFVGVSLLLGAFAVLLWRGFRLAQRASAIFDRYLAFGLTCFIGVPALFNVAVVTGLLPTKGLPLPFLSFGGSHLLTTMIAVGMLLRIDRDAHYERVAAAQNHTIAHGITAEIQNNA